MIINAYNESLRPLLLPFLECEDGCFAADGALWNVVVVRLQIVQQSGLQISPAIETGLLQQLVDAPVEALDHAIGLRMASVQAS